MPKGEHALPKRMPAVAETGTGIPAVAENGAGTSARAKVRIRFLTARNLEV